MARELLFAICNSLFALRALFKIDQGVQDLLGRCIIEIRPHHDGIVGDRIGAYNRYQVLRLKAVSFCYGQRAVINGPGFNLPVQNVNDDLVMPAGKDDLFEELVRIETLSMSMALG